MKNLEELNSTELKEVQGGGWSDFWDAVLDFWGVPDEVRSDS